MSNCMSPHSIIWLGRWRIEVQAHPNTAEAEADYDGMVHDNGDGDGGGDDG